MTASVGPTTAGAASGDTEPQRVDAAGEDLLGLLDDEYVREVLLALVDEPKTAAAIAADCDCSRPTVYRRLDRLTEAGLVTTSLSIGADGHHRKLFRRRFDGLTVDLREDGWSVAVETVEAASRR